MTTARRGLVDRIAGSYPNMRGEAKELLAERPSELVVLSFMALAGLAFFIGRVIELVVRMQLTPNADAASLGATQAQIGAYVIGFFVMLPLGIYLLALFTTPFLRIAGGGGSYYETRLAISWSAVVAFPIIIVISVLNILSEHGYLNDIAAFTLKIAPTALWAYFLASAIAAMHGLRSARRVLGATALLVCVVAGVLLFIRTLPSL